MRVNFNVRYKFCNSDSLRVKSHFKSLMRFLYSVICFEACAPFISFTAEIGRICPLMFYWGKKERAVISSFVGMP